MTIFKLLDLLSLSVTLSHASFAPKPVRRKSAGLILKAIALSCVCAPMSAANAQADGETIGLVVSSKKFGIYETEFMDECPAGLAVGNDEYWWRSLTPAKREELTLGGIRETAANVRQDMALHRGPNGEHICHFPEVVKDPPLRTVEGRISYGLDLDGRDGAGENSCKHNDFVGINGETGIDNQFYRIFGCIAAWRSFGFISLVSDDDRKSSGLGMILIEVSGVNDRMNDDDVTVHFYRGIDPHRLDSQGRVLPFSTYRIDADAGEARYNSTAKGKIVDGVLYTEPTDIYLPLYAIVVFQRQQLRGMKLEIALPDSSGRGEGVIGGYADKGQLEDYILALGGLGATGQFSCPAIYDAIDDLADGYPDPETGECAGVSTAYRVEVASAFIEKPAAFSVQEAAAAPQP